MTTRHIPPMKHLLYPILLCSLLCSCLLSHQRILDYAYVYDAVQVTDLTTYYEHEGKYYIQGQRIKATQRDPEYWWWHIKGSYSYYFKPIPGTEGEIVYREVKLNRKDGKTLMYSPCDSSWQSIHPQPTQRHKADGLEYLCGDRVAPELTEKLAIDSDRQKQLCGHALYAIPGSIAALVLVDIPATAAGWSLAAAASVIALPATLPQQQTPTPVVPVPVPEEGTNE